MTVASSTIPDLTPALVTCIRDTVSCRTAHTHRDDIRQDAVVSILGRLRAAPQRVELSPAYVRQAARNTAVDHLRRSARRQRLLDRNQSLLSERMVTADPECLASGRQLASAVMEHLQALSDNRREVVGLFLAGHSIGEIAERTGRNRKQVDNLVYRGLAALRRRLEEAGVTPSSCLRR